MAKHEDVLRDRVAPFVNRLEQGGYEASVFGVQDYSIKVAITEDGRNVGPVVVYYKSSEDTFSIKGHEMRDRSHFDSIKQVFYASEKTDIGPGYHAFVDGSFQNDCIGYGWVVYRDDKLQAEDWGTVDQFESMQQVVGELKAAVEALNWCVSQEVDTVDLHYDYEGIEKWAIGEWKTKNALTKRYASLMDSLSIEVNWVKEEAHTGVIGNERADRLAGKGCQSNGSPDTDLISELREEADRFLEYVESEQLLDEAELSAEKVMNEDFYRINVLEGENVVGRFDLYNTTNKRLEPQLDSFESISLRDAIEEIWEWYRLEKQFPKEEDIAIQTAHHYYEVYKPYRELPRIDMSAFAEALEQAYAVIRDEDISLGEHRTDFDALEEHLQRLDYASNDTSHLSN